jgi:lipoate---protein ligase
MTVEPEGWSVDQRRGSAEQLHRHWPLVEELPTRRAVAVCRVNGPAVVLGSSQPVDAADRDRAAAAGCAVVRRRSGGGAVLVTPEDPMWIDVWVPVGDPLWSADVGRAFDWLGDTWARALEAFGVHGARSHRGRSASCTRWSALVCFGGVGTGEVVLADGRKMVGLAQRRNRFGAWFHGAAFAHWDPQPLVDLLALPPDERTAAVADLRAAVAGVEDAVPRTEEDVSSLADGLTAAVLASLP